MADWHPVEDLANPDFNEEQSVLEFEGQPIHVQFMRANRPTDAVIFRFHGAIKRDLRPLPAFQPNLKQMRGHAHQITICDPTMMSREGFSCAWFAGHEDLDTQGLLRKFCARVVNLLGATRTIYLGSSAGGFMALYLSWHDPKSVALVTVPQTNVRQHFMKSSVKAYFDACWPGKTPDEVAQLTCLNVCDLYRDGFENSVIYVQSMGDMAHNALQMTPFLNAAWGEIPSEDRNLALVSDFWGKMGHAGVIPHEGYLPWLKAAVSAPEVNRESLLMTYHTMSREMPVMTSAKDRPKGDFAANDLRMADLLRDIALKRVKPDGSKA